MGVITTVLKYGIDFLDCKIKLPEQNRPDDINIDDDEDNNKRKRLLIRYRYYSLTHLPFVMA